MALHETIKSKINRQELDTVLIGPHFNSYSAKTKYLPKNIRKPDFFSLCYGLLKVGDEISIYTQSAASDNKFEVYFKFLVTKVDKEEKVVETKTLAEVDLLKPESPLAEIAGLDTTPFLEAIDELKAKIEDLTAKYENYVRETDDQLEEIENTLDSLKEA